MRERTSWVWLVILYQRLAACKISQLVINQHLALRFAWDKHIEPRVVLAVVKGTHCTQLALARYGKS